MVGVYSRSAGLARGLSAEVIKMMFDTALVATMAIGRADALSVDAANAVPMAGLATPTTRGALGTFATVFCCMRLICLCATFINASHCIGGEGLGEVKGGRLT